jgi:phage terminase large subunit
MSGQIQIKLPIGLACLSKPSRYKILYGGRGAAKSWGVARSLLIRGCEKPTRVLCAREFQSSIRDSVHRLLADQIEAMGLSAFYRIEQAAIFGLNGTEFSFEGIRHNVNKIKSYEGVDIAWVEEAQTVSKSSWETLIPTIRRPDSEIWVTFNPELDTDETYKRFVLNPPPGAIVKKLNYTDNPWFPIVLRDEMELLKARDEDAYLNIWEGHCRVTLDGAIYATEMRQMTTEGRICKVPYDETLPVHTYWDLGFADHTSILFAQKVGFEYHIIDAYQNRLQKMPHYLKVLQDRGYVYGTHYMPHDADHEMLAAASIKRQMERVNHNVVVLGRVEKKMHGVNAAKAIFNRLYVDESKCADFLQAVRHYRFKVDEHGQWSKDPLHDEYSHYADALQALGQSIGAKTQGVEAPRIEFVSVQPDSANVQWMGV